jgi:hypothetical protein
MQPYNYTIDLPPPAPDTFLQDIMGIQQLKGLRQQQEIAQQNAAFQKEMQPLEMARAKAAIDAARVSAGLTGVQADAARENLTALKERNALVKSYQSKAFEMAKDPTSWTPESLKSLQMMAVAVDPPGVEAISKFSEKVPSAIPLLSDAATYVSLAANSGKPGLIVPKLEQYVSAVQEKVDANPNDKVAKIQLQFLQANLATAMVDPNAAGFEALSFLASANDKGYDNVLKGIKQPVEIAEIEARTKSTKQEKQVDEEKRALDLDKERLQIQELQQRVAAGRVQKVRDFASANKEGYKLKDQADSQALQAQKAKDILQTIDSVQDQLPKNIGQSFVQFLRDKIPQYSNDISFLRTQYKSLIAPEAKKNLPPGSASDADMKLAREGIMNANANPKQFRKAVEIIARETENQAKYTEAKLAWMSDNNGSIGSAKKDLDVFGSNVPKGTSLSAWWSKVGKNLDPYAMPSEASPAAAGGNPTDVDSILKRFGVPQ